MKVGYCIGVATADLTRHIAAITDWTYMILQGPGDIRFTWFDPDTTWTDWEQGIIFGASAELRWRKRRGGLLHLVLITAGELPAGFNLIGEAQRIQNDCQQLYLWGERIFDKDKKPTATWVEGRIPQIISDPRGYPLNTEPHKPPCRVALQVEILELPRPAPTALDLFDPSPPRRLERYKSVVEVPGGSP
ncbi:MAG: hypothetical protein PHW74_10445 [Desulfobacca sp.]|nr:hypothetical protein [Desulfobacca sp.]